VHVGSGIGVTIQVMNSGGTDIPSPFMEVRAGGVAAGQEDMQLYNPGADQLPGVLPPPYRASIGLGYDPQPPPPGARPHLQPGVADPSAIPMNWDSTKEMYRPSYVSTEAWDAVWSNFRPAVGNTLDDFYRVLQNDSRNIIDFTNSIHDLLRFELERAADDLPALPAVGPLVDLALPAPGLSLAFTRQFGSSLFDRFRNGRLGRGWFDNFDISVTTDSTGLVT